MKSYLGLITLATLCTLIIPSSSLANKVMSTSSPEVRGITGQVALFNKNRVKRKNTEHISKVPILGTETGGEGGDYECDPLAQCNRMIELDPKSSGRYIIRAMFKADKLQDYRGAMADYDRAIQMSPKFSDHYYRRAKFKADKLRDYKGAIADHNRVIQMYPNDSDSYLSRAFLKLEIMRDYPGGDADCSLAMKYASNSKEVTSVYHICFMSSGNKKWLNPSLK
jgi:tetratricopeptide (TPR) repeat protein